MMGKKWIGYARLLAEVPSTSCEVYKLPKRVGRPWVPWSRVHYLYLLGFLVNAFKLDTLSQLNITNTLKN